MYRKTIHLFVLLAALLLAACGGNPAPTEGNGSGEATGEQSGESAAQAGGAEQAPLRLGLLPITDVIPIYVAKEEGFFEEEGVEVELISVASAAERDTLLQTGQIDGQLNDLVSTVLTNAGSETKIRIVRQSRAAFPDYPQLWILSAPDSGIEEVEDLKGQEIAISENSMIEYVTDRLLQYEGLSEEEIVTTNVPQIPTRLQLLLEGQIPAANLPDPLASLAVLQGANVVVTDAAHPEVSQSVISFRAEVLEERRDQVDRFLRAYDRALEAVNQAPEAYQNILVAYSRVPEPLLDQYELPQFPVGAIPSEEQVADVVQWALDKGLIEAPLSYEEMVDSSFPATR